MPMADTNSGSLDAGGAHARTGGASAAAPLATTSWAGQAAYQARWGMLVDKMTPEQQPGGGSAAAPLAADGTVKPVPRFPTVSPTGKHCSQQANTVPNRQMLTAAPDSGAWQRPEHTSHSASRSRPPDCFHHGVQAGPVRGGGRSASRDFKTFLDDEAFLAIPETRSPSPVMCSSPLRAIVSPVRPPDPAAGVGGSMEECGDAMDEDGGSMDGWGDVMEEQDDAVGNEEAIKPMPRSLKHAMDEEEEDVIEERAAMEEGEEAAIEERVIRPAPRSLKNARPSSNASSGSGTSSS